ncbi:MAG: hypothetical protein ACE15F_11960 [bacterium]
MRPIVVFSLVALGALVSFAQDSTLTDQLMYEGTFEDWTTTAWWFSSPITVTGVFIDIPGNETEAMELTTTGDTANIWDEQMGTNWTTPENSTTLAWRIQFRVRVDYAPYNIPTYLQINEDPWSGVSTTITIPAGFEKKWLSYDLILGPSNVFTTADMGLRFQLGAQKAQTLQFDDIRVYLTQALTNRSYDSNTENRIVVVQGGTYEAVTMDGAPNGTGIGKATIDKPGSSLSDASVVLARISKNRKYDGAYRLNLTARSSVAPLQLNAVITNAVDGTGTSLSAVEPVTISQKNAWTDLSFLMPPVPSEWSLLYPVLYLGGQGNVVLEFDNLYLYRTNEATPVSIRDWSLF